MLAALAATDPAVDPDKYGRLLRAVDELADSRVSRAVTFTKVAAGAYVAATERGDYSVDMIAGEWFVTFPGCRAADGVTSTLREARAMIEADA